MFVGLLAEVAHGGNRIRGGYMKTLHANGQHYCTLSQVFGRSYLL
jgi:hypothetical protein